MKNLKLAFLDSHIIIKFLMGLFMTICTSSYFLTKTEPVPTGAEAATLLYTFNIMVFGYNFILFTITNTPLYKTLPLKNADITVTIVLKVFIGMLVYFGATALLIALCGFGSMVPYYGGAFLISGLITAAVMPPVFCNTKYGADAVREAEDKPKSQMVKALIVGGGVTLAAGVPGTVLLYHGWTTGPQSGKDIPLLAAVYGGCILLAVIITPIYKKVIKYYTN